MRTESLIVLWTFLSSAVCSQDADTLLAKTTQNGIELRNVRPAILHISARTLPAITGFPAEGKQTYSNYKINKSYNLKLNVPLLLSKRLNIIGQLRYKNEQLHFGFNSDFDEKEIHFDNVGASFLFKYKLKSSYFVGGHASGFFKADELTFERYSSILDFNSSLVFGKDLLLGSIGFGAVFGNSLDRFTIYPLFLFEYQLSNSWKVEMKLPKEIQFRKIIRPDAFYILAGAEVNAANYFISEPLLTDQNNLEYRRAAVDFRIGVEKEIYDFLWIGADFGATQPIYSALVQQGEPTRNKLFDFGHSFTPYASFSIFLVPPRSLMQKLR